MCVYHVFIRSLIDLFYVAAHFLCLCFPAGHFLRALRAVLPKAQKPTPNLAYKSVLLMKMRVSGKHTRLSHPNEYSLVIRGVVLVNSALRYSCDITLYALFAD